VRADDIAKVLTALASRESGARQQDNSSEFDRGLRVFHIGRSPQRQRLIHRIKNLSAKILLWH